MKLQADRDRLWLDYSGTQHLAQCQANMASKYSFDFDSNK